MTDLAFHALGPLEVRKSGEQVELGSPRQQSVLAVLFALADTVVSAGRLIDEVWGEDAPQRVEHSLHTYVSNLRRALGRDTIETVRPGYLLRVGGESDVAQFEKLLERGRGLLATNPAAAAADLEQALGLWRGEEPYAGLSADIGVLNNEAARLRELLLIAREHRSEARLELGDHDALIPDLRDLISRFPYREGLRAALMRALYRAGRQTEALRAYQEFRTLLAEELATDPSPELEDLEFRLLTHTDEKPAGNRAVNTLPHLPSTLIGREAELSAVGDTLESARLVTLTGPAGVGKTRLAIAAAQSVLDRFPDGVCFTDLAAVSSDADIPLGVLKGLQMGDQSGRAPEEVVTEHLAGRRMLLVLDNCEHVVEEAARLVWEWITDHDGLRVLASSQESLGLHGEQVMRIPPLSIGEEGGGSSAAEELFLTRVRDQIYDFTPSRQDRAAIRDICRVLDGLPLAIELAAARVPVLKPAEIASRLGDRFTLLGSAGRSGPARHRSLRQAVEWSYSLLDDGTRSVFDRLAVLSGDFSYAAAEALAGDQGEHRFLETLDSLIRRSLVGKVETKHSSRYRMLETMRLFGRERLSAQSMLEELEELRAIFFARRATELAALVPTAEYRTAIAAIEADLDNIRAAFRWAVERSRFQVAFDLTRPMWTLLTAGARHHLHESREWRERLMTADPGMEMRARLLAEQAFSCVLTGEQAEGTRLAAASLAIAVDGSGEQSLALEVQAHFAGTAQETDKALAIAEQVIATKGESSDDHAHESKAMALIFAGRGREAVAVVEQIFRASDRLGNPLRRIRALALMGAALQSVDPNRSLEVLDEAVATTEELGMDWDLAGALMARAMTRSMVGDPAGSLADLARASRLTYEVRDVRRLAQTLEILGSQPGTSSTAEQATMLLSSAAAIRDAAGVVSNDFYESRRQDKLTELAALMDPEDFARAVEWGRMAGLADAADSGVALAAALLTAVGSDD